MSLIPQILAGYAIVGLAIAALLLVINATEPTLVLERHDGKPRPGWQKLLFFVLVVLLWPVPLALLALSMGQRGDPPGPPAMGGT